jgi:hypothetical protein
VNLISISAIKIAPNRQRRQFDAAALHELADSIQARSLYHPIVLRVVGEDYQLVSGERRLRAVIEIWALGGTFFYNGEPVPEGCIPYTTLGELNDLDAEEAELEENILRRIYPGRNLPKLTLVLSFSATNKQQNAAILNQPLQNLQLKFAARQKGSIKKLLDGSLSSLDILMTLKSPPRRTSMMRSSSFAGKKPARKTKPLESKSDAHSRRKHIERLTKTVLVG